MDFFREQDLARRTSRWLVVLFLLAVACIIAAVYLIALSLSGHFLGHFHGPAVTQTAWWNPQLFMWTAGGTGLLIGGGSLVKIAELSRGGGVSVATALGGRLVSRSTDDHLERRLLNVVDEMAIASGVPVPQVFILEEESGINAFAAGTTPNNAVVAVTRGSLERLSRDQLQGVIAHEFSHIFNGDMRLNLRLIGLLNGILLLALAGRVIVRGSEHSRSKSAGGIVLLGFGLLVVGYVGVFFGRMIKAAVSRQREFLADASAVQYTRNPDGIAGALKKIAGVEGRVDHPKAEEASHLFFAQGLTFAFARLFATHPPVEERIARLDPAFAALHAGPSVTAAGSLEEPAMGFATGPGLADSPEMMGSIGHPDIRHTQYARQVIGLLPEAVYADLNRPEQVASVLYGMLVMEDKNPEATLNSVLADAAVVNRSLGHLNWLRKAGRAIRLPIVELAIPALQELPRPTVEQVLSRIDALVKADGRISIFEFALTAVLEQAINERAPVHPSRSIDLAEIRSAVTVILSLLAHAGHSDEGRARAAFLAATAKGPLEGPWEMLDRSALSIRTLEPSLARLERVNYRFKRRLMEACLAALAADGIIAVNEAELFRAFGARLGVPVPPLLPGPVQGGSKPLAPLDRQGARPPTPITATQD